MKPVLATTIFCLDGDKVLLMYRNKVPNKGLWIGPGGKMESGESPYECARRELLEETGLLAHHLHFRGLVTEVSPRITIPDADRTFIPKVVDMSQPFFQAKFFFDGDLKLIKMIDQSG